MKRQLIEYGLFTTIVLLGFICLIEADSKRNKWTCQVQRIIWLVVLFPALRVPPRGATDG